jgi:hypothetical protein
MPLLVKGGKLASIGGALKRFVAGCLDACCGKWYCHLPDYSCDQNDFDYISEHSSRVACLQACGDGVEHYCHTGGSCDTDPTDAVATYPSKKDCEAACGQWWCCYESLDYTKGSECKEGPCDLPELIRAGPFDSKQDCDPECEMQYYCVLVDGTDGSQPDHYMCVTDPAGMTVLAGPQSEAECDATCYSRRPTIWCVDEKRCVLSFNGPPVECSFGVFCEEYDDFIACGQECLKEKWYCVPADNQCMQLALPPTPDAQPYGSQQECEKECQSYYCCWVSQGDPTKGSYCQIGECDPGFEKSGPHDDKGICEADCHSIYCWSYYDTATSETVKVCQEDSPDDPAHENVTQVSGPYGKASDCERVCNPPVYKWFCENEVCVRCCQSGTCAPTDRSCPASGNFSTEEDCKLSCGSPCYFCEDGTVTEDHLPAGECTDMGGFLDKADADEACKTPECSDDGECGTWFIDIYDGTGGDHPECDDESQYPPGGPFQTVSAAQAWGQANTPASCLFTLNGFPNPNLACRDGKCVPADNPLP